MPLLRKNCKVWDLRDPAPLQVDDIDGDNLNNELDNPANLVRELPHARGDVGIHEGPQAARSSAGGVIGSRARLRSVCLRT